MKTIFGIVLLCCCLFKLPAQTSCNVKNFGAIGNGLIDDSKAIQSAIDSAARCKNGQVYFPPGTYALSRASNAKAGCLYLANNSKLTTDSANPARLILLPQQPNFTRMVYVERVQAVTIQNLVFDGNSQNQAQNGKINEHLHAIYINEANEVSVSNCTFTHTGGDGIGIRGPGLHPSKNINITGCRFVATHRDAITLGSGFSNIKIANCIFDSTVHSSIHIEPESGITKNVVITNNQFIGCYNVSISGYDTLHPVSNVMVSNNTFKNTFLWCCRSQHVTVSNNEFTFTKPLSTKGVINAIQYNEALLIKKNKFHINGMYLLALTSTTSQIKDVEVTANQIETNFDLIKNVGCKQLKFNDNKVEIVSGLQLMDLTTNYPMKEIEVSGNAFSQPIKWGPVKLIKQNKLSALKVKKNTGLAPVQLSTINKTKPKTN